MVISKGGTIGFGRGGWNGVSRAVRGLAWTVGPSCWVRIVRANLPVQDLRVLHKTACVQICGTATVSLRFSQRDQHRQYLSICSDWSVVFQPSFLWEKFARGYFPTRETDVAPKERTKGFRRFEPCRKRGCISDPAVGRVGKKLKADDTRRSARLYGGGWEGDGRHCWCINVPKVQTR